MRTDFDLFEVNQIWLLKTGQFVLIGDIDPITKLNPTESSRRVYCKLGRTYKKGEQFKEKNKFIVIFENAPTESTITIDCSKASTYTIEELRKQAVMLVGKLNADACKQYNRVLSDYMNGIEAYN